MADKKDDYHGFDVTLAVAVGVEKAILIGYFQYWISENEKRKSADHFQQGEYWTYTTVPDLVKVYPYLKGSSIYRWLDQLESDGWIKTGRFNQKQIDQTKWYGRGKRMLAWLNPPISQNGKSDNLPNYQNAESNYQNDKPDSQNDRSDYQNDNCNIKDTVINPLVNSVITLSLENAGGAVDESAEVVTAEVIEPDVEAESMPSNRPAARPRSAAPLSPGDQAELEEFTGKLQADRRLLEMLSRLHKIRDEPALDWIAQYVLSQWGGNNLTGRTHKDLVMHCQSWIGTKLQNQHERQQRTGQSTARNYPVGNRTRQSPAETGTELDRIADQYFGNGG